MRLPGRNASWSAKGLQPLPAPGSGAETLRHAVAALAGQRGAHRGRVPPGPSGDAQYQRPAEKGGSKFHGEGSEFIKEPVWYFPVRHMTRQPGYISGNPVD